MRNEMMLALGGAALLAACTTAEGGSEGGSAGGSPAVRSAVAELRTSTGAPAGRATATAVNGGVRVSVEASSISPGPHGLHVHTVGRCDAPDFTTAGGHWNPTSMQHGAQNPQGPHSGDMPNLIAGADGRGSIAINLPSGTMDGLLDADGSAIVIHATADDMKTDPSGNSGGRIACGVFSAG